MINLKITTHTDKEMQNVGITCGKAITAGTIFLHGEMGAGKTTFCRGFLSELGIKGNEFAGSPTYNYVSEYHLDELSVYHWDLYRFDSPEHFMAKGLHEIQTEKGIHLVEWPEKLTPKLVTAYPQPHLVMRFEITGKNKEKRNLQLKKL